MSARAIRRSWARKSRQGKGRRRIARTAGVVGAGALIVPSAAGATNFTVNLGGDGGDLTCDGTCTLRDAVDDANTTGGADTISFAGGVTGEITLITSKGPIPITDDLTINGPGAGVLSVSGDTDGNNAPTFVSGALPAQQGDTRIFDISDPSMPGNPTQKVTISGLTLKEGVADAFSGGYQDKSGGAVYATGTELHLKDDTLTGNRATRSGGAVYLNEDPGGNAARLVVANSTFTNNRARGNGGAISSAPNKYDPNDGIAGTVITNSQISGNRAGSDGSGWGPFTGTYSGDGGALSLKYQLSISATTIANNTVVDSGSSDGTGGGVYAPISGGDITATTIRGNTTAGNAGGIAMGGVDLKRSTVSGNTASFSGGVFALPGTKYSGSNSRTRIDDSTISGNTATNSPDPYDGIGGGIGVYGFGDDTLILRDSTVARNSGATGSGIFAITEAPDGEPVVRLKSSIVADNTGSADLFGGDVPPSMGVFPPQPGLFVGGFSLVERPGSAGLEGDPSGSNITGVDPKLGPLANNGGPTQTMALGPTSVAVDAAQSNGFPTDQRGQERAVDSRATNALLSDGTDMGAYEVQDLNAPGDDDVTKPTAEITKAPKKLKLKPGKTTAKAKVKFKGADDRTPAAQLRFECKLDKGKFESCSSPLKLKLDKGKHKLKVRAVDKAGNVGNSAKAKIKVVAKKGN
jgi:predicted outer membrane repeat protein